MEVKINNNNEMLDATIEIENGVMVVSPKESDKVDIAQFKDGDVITCGWEEENKCCSWVCILRGVIQAGLIYDSCFYIQDFCGMYLEGRGNDVEFWASHSDSETATYVRYASEEERRQLFDKLKEEGWEFDFEKKELVKLKWKPKEGEEFWLPLYYASPYEFKPIKSLLNKGRDKAILDKAWCFKTKEECQEFCNRLNQAIEGVKP